MKDTKAMFGDHDPKDYEVTYNKEDKCFDVACSLFSTPEMVAMSLMSNAQEEIARGMIETARITLNVAKLVLANLETAKRLHATGSHKI